MEAEVYDADPGEPLHDTDLTDESVFDGEGESITLDEAERVAEAELDTVRVGETLTLEERLAVCEVENVTDGVHDRWMDRVHEKESDNVGMRVVLSDGE